MKREKDRHISPDKLASQLTRFFEGANELIRYTKALESVVSLMDKCYSEPQIFEMISHGKGDPTTHVSGCVEGDTKKGLVRTPKSNRRQQFPYIQFHNKK